LSFSPHRNRCRRGRRAVKYQTWLPRATAESRSRKRTGPQRILSSTRDRADRKKRPFLKDQKRDLDLASSSAGSFAYIATVGYICNTRKKALTNNTYLTCVRYRPIITNAM
jgi:hypothetical protein